MSVVWVMWAGIIGHRSDCDKDEAIKVIYLARHGQGGWIHAGPGWVLTSLAMHNKMVDESGLTMDEVSHHRVFLKSCLIFTSLNDCMAVLILLCRDWGSSSRRTWPSVFRLR